MGYGLPVGKDNIIPIIPIYTYSKLRTLVAVKKLYEKGVYVNPVLPPAAPEGECLIRTSYMATHTRKLLAEAAETIKEVISSLPMDEEKLMELLQNE